MITVKRKGLHTLFKLSSLSRYNVSFEIFDTGMSKVSDGKILSIAQLWKIAFKNGSLWKHRY